jgi:thiol-disulfide isomerase/thioredoxin
MSFTINREVAVANPNLIEFYGKECPHCMRVEKVVSQFEKKHKITITKLEVWHNKENKEVLETVPAFASCGGVPFFYNKENGKAICGECTLEVLEDWADLV